MAPRSVGDHSRYWNTGKHPQISSRRVVKVLEKLRDFDSANVREKENFFLSLGLRLRRIQCEYPTLQKNRKNMKVNIPSDAKLRECSVVILGEKCNTCGRCFKCKTDLNHHAEIHHYSEEIANARNTNHVKSVDVKRRVCKYCHERFLSALELKRHVRTIHRHKPSKLCIILKIGDDVISKLSIKRKHLTLEKSNQREDGISEFESEDGRLNTKKLRFDSGTMDIRIVDVENNTSTSIRSVTTINGGNQYCHSRFIQSGSPIYENRLPKALEINENRQRIDINNRIEPLYTSASGQRSVLQDIPNKVNPIEPFRKLLVENNRNKPYNEENDVPSFARIGETSPSNRAIMRNSLNKMNAEIRENQESIESIESIQIAKSTKEDIDIKSKNRVRLPIEASQNNLITSVNINRRNISKRTQPTRSIDDSRSTTETKKGGSSGDRASHSSAVSTDVESSCRTDEEIQEVLRISRGSVPKDRLEINHESPTRSERHVLLLDAIRDMLRMEQQGYHLLSERYTKGGKGGKEANEANEANEKEGCVATDMQPAEKNVPKGVLNINCDVVPETSGKTLHQMLTSIPTIFDTSMEELSNYGISYYNDVLDINQNMEKIQESELWRQRTPCW